MKTVYQVKNYLYGSYYSWGSYFSDKNLAVSYLKQLRDLHPDLNFCVITLNVPEPGEQLTLF